MLSTAAHCLGKSLNSYYIIFEFELFSQNGAKVEFEESDVYTVQSVVASGSPTGSSGDYGVFLLDRPVTGRSAFSKATNSVSIGESVLMIGYPVGLPKKFDEGGIITSATSSLIRGTVDSYGGNSGSPVFDGDNNLVGMLVGGAPDFISQGHCEVSNICPGGSGCSSSGEYIVPVCVVLDAPEVAALVSLRCTQDDNLPTVSEIQISSQPGQIQIDVESSSSSYLLVSVVLFSVVFILF